MEKFIEEMVDIMDIEEHIEAESMLEDLEEWDSLSIVSFMAMANTKYGKKLSVSDVRSARTVLDLYELVK